MTSPDSSAAPPGEAASVLTQLDELRRKIAGLDELHRLTRQINARLTTLDTRVEYLSSGLDVAEDTAVPTPEPAATDTTVVSGGPGTAVDIGALVSWVRDHVARLIEKKIPQNQGRVRWCRSWWLHAEAIARFDALHRSWSDAIYGDENALVVYYDHLDRQLAVLTSEDGPFAACRGGDHAYDSRVGALGHVDPGPDFYRDHARALEQARRAARPAASPPSTPPPATSEEAEQR
ncbi:DUF4913 domain-containing protein [Pseudonocardia sp. ICBG601]|uniref:DUF4913 domain-containing protein n=1 Tax=Pseudonocardia sp. ICBG601 TaxID=2846759 RepID=UPI001CF66BF0|nr:DUF4913 domain-containing protein [Pseudonocardia sp. ICBG601]